MSLTGKRVAVLVEQQYQEMEVWYPVYRLREAGCVVELVGPEAGKTYASKLGYPAKADPAVSARVSHGHSTSGTKLRAMPIAHATVTSVVSG